MLGTERIYHGNRCLTRSKYFLNTIFEVFHHGYRLEHKSVHIQFTREIEEDQQIPFLDVNTHRKSDGTLKTTVYRKATHTYQYLNWNSNHPLEHKRSVVRTLLNRVETHVSDLEDREAEKQHVLNVLRANGYKDWALHIPNQQDAAARSKQKSTDQPSTRPPSVGIPYIQGLSEELQRIFKKHGVNVYHKPINTLRSLLVKPKDPTDNHDKCGTIYHIPCGSCDDFYIGETSRKMGVRFKEHKTTKPKNNDQDSAIFEHIQNTGHSVSFEDVRILAREAKYAPRKIKEALEIHKHKPPLNRDVGWVVPPILLDLLPLSQDPTATSGPGRVLLVTSICIHDFPLGSHVTSSISTSCADLTSDLPINTSLVIKAT